MMVATIPASIDGHDIANDILRDVHAGALGLAEVRRWIVELRGEGLSELAAQVEARLPLFH